MREVYHGGRKTILSAARFGDRIGRYGTKFVLLAPDEDVLVARVVARNDTRAHKWIEHAKNVREEHLRMAKDGVFDLVIAENCSPEETLKKIARHFAFIVGMR